MSPLSIPNNLWGSQRDFLHTIVLKTRKRRHEKIEEEEDKVRSKEMKSIPFCSLFYQVDVGNE